MVEEKCVSVIVPVFNAANTLERSIRSLMDQTLQGVEIIAVNDASTDDSLAIMQALAAECSNLVLIDLPDNKGVHEARLMGVEAATSAWIGFLDADDIALPKMYETMYCAGEEHVVDIVACGSYRVTSNRKLIASKISYGSNSTVTEDIFEKFCSFEFGTGTLWNKLFRLELVKPWKGLRYPWRQNTNEDLLFSIGLFLNAKSLYLVKGMLHEYVHRSDSVTSNIGSPESFVNNYRAYAIAVSVYSEYGEAVLRNITSMYRKQLEFSSCRVKSIDDLYEHGEGLQEALDVVSKWYPLGLALLASRSVTPSLFERVVHTVYSKMSWLFFKCRRFE